MKRFIISAIALVSIASIALAASPASNKANQNVQAPVVKSIVLRLNASGTVESSVETVTQIPLASLQAQAQSIQNNIAVLQRQLDSVNQEITIVQGVLQSGKSVDVTPVTGN